MNFDMLLDNSILVVDNNVKDMVIESIRNTHKLIDVKFMSFLDIKRNFYFSYDDKTIYYMIKKYNYKYDVCVKYLESLYYVFDDDYGYEKVKKLILLKKELISNNLLYFNNLFVDSLKGKNIIIYNCTLCKFDYMLIDKLRSVCNVNIYNDSNNKYEHKFLYQFDDILDEVSFVGSSIAGLIHDGVCVNDIKICGINLEYKNIIKRVFSFYNIPIVFNDSYLYATGIGRDFLDNLSNNVNDTLEYISSKYDICDSGVIDIYNSIVSIVNKYAWCDDILSVKEMICNDFKHTLVNKVNLDFCVEVIDSLSLYKDKYVFLMNFSQGMVPSIFKDEDLLSDKIKSNMGIDTSYDLNSLFYNKWYNDILECKNLVISYKMHSSSLDFYISSLNDLLKLEVISGQESFNYSNIYNKIKLASDIDNLIKYNTTTDRLAILYNNYKDIGYISYDNRYSSIDRDMFFKYLDNNLVLSYSALNNYYHCSFKYYLSNILKLNLFEETFSTIIGNLFHYILSICFDRDIDIRFEYYEYIRKCEYEFDAREKFFLDNLFCELLFVIDTIKMQYGYSSLNNCLYEDKIEIDKSFSDMKIIFKGFVDKIIMDDEKSLALIVDYKTGSASASLNNSIYGLDLQLPIYVYLAKYKFPNIRIAGFYLQKILNGCVSIDSKKSYDSVRIDRLKLHGYTNSSLDVIKRIDSGYMDSKVIYGMKVNSKGISSKKIMDDVCIDNLCKITEDKIDSAIKDILDVKFDINPKRIGANNIGCMYCGYRDICFMNERDVVNLEEYKDLDFLNNI